jgi:quinol monooxygenase YgiN
MLQRIVKMHFRAEEVEGFLTLFESVKWDIRSSEGCLALKLLRDQQNPCIFFTYSVWEGPEFLERYRHSELFGRVWKSTKSKFAHRAEAWSVDLLHEL